MKAIIILSILVVLAYSIPSIPLYNAAVDGLTMPLVGIGTGGYGKEGNIGGEYWDDAAAQKAVSQWIALGGPRIDTANDYGTQLGIAKAIANVERSSLFITSKVGPRYPLGYQETLDQADEILKQLNTTYVDLLLIHWPGDLETNIENSTCKQGTSYKQCRQDSWRAMEVIFKAGKARAIGVSNFEQHHLNEIFEMKGLIPAVNQVEFHPYWHEDDLVRFCKDRNITFNGYSNAGAPDHMGSPDYPERWAVQIKDQPLIVTLANKYAKSPVQIILKWSLQQGLVINPRTWNADHMKENLSLFDFELTDSEMRAIANVPKPLNNKVCPNPMLIS